MEDLIMNHRIIEEALRYLARRCDGAGSKDERGFNGRDTGFGKDLAARLFGPGFHATESRYRLSDKQHTAALKMLRTYVGQLGGGGIELPTDAELADFLARRREFDDAAEANAPKYDGRLEAVGQALRCLFPFNADLQAKLKAIKDDKGKQAVRWSGTCWEIPIRHLAAVTALANWEIAPSAQKAYEDALAEIAAEQARQQGEAERLERERERRVWEMQQLLALADLDAPLPGALDRTLFPHQKDCVRLALQYRTDHPELRGVLIADDMGLGKANLLTTNILTPTGWKQMGDIRVGDNVIGVDGKPTKVIGVYPQGVLPVYRVHFTDGSSVECSDEHLWAVRTPCQKYRGKDYTVMPLTEIMRNGIAHKNGNLKYYIPMVKPIEFEGVEPLLIPAYLMGVLLGDGTLTHKTTGWSKPDTEIADHVSKLLPPGYTINNPPSTPDQWNVVTTLGQSNPMTREIRRIGLNCTAEKKFIPEIYKFAPVQDRIDLLQGLLDTDGSVSDSLILEYGSVSKQLAEDVQFLVESLGGVAYMSEKIPTYTHKGERRTGQRFYRLNISLPPEILPFKLSRKLNKYTPRSKYPPSRGIKHIEYVGEAPCQCIAVDSPEHLYVTEHCIVTHNTTASLVLARAYQRLYHAPIIVICPASLKDNWLREAAMVGVQIEVYSWAKQPKPLEDRQYILIADEGHYAQNPKSSRSKAFMELATAPTCRIALPLTGTPIKNGRPVNMYPLLKALNHPIAKSKTEYEKRYCAAGPTRFSPWDASGASHLDELHRKITKEVPVMIRRTKKECLKFLPPKTRIMRPAEVSSEATKVFRETLIKLRAEFAERLRIKRQELIDQGEDPNIANVKAKKAEAIVALTQLRHASSMAKVEYTIEFAQEILEEGNQVVISCQFKAAADRIAKALNAEIISGDVAPKNRQPIVDRFQAGERKAIVLMGEAGGVGITLTAATYILLHDRDYVPGQNIQIEDRIYRIGQENPVFAYWIQAFDVDIKIDQIVAQKSERIELVLSGKRKTLRGLESIADIADELIEEFL